MRNTHGTIYFGIDVSKDKLAVAITSGERGNGVLSLGTFENTLGSVDKLLKKLSGRGDISACYEETIANPAVPRHRAICQRCQIVGEGLAA